MEARLPVADRLRHPPDLRQIRCTKVGALRRASSGFTLQDALSCASQLSVGSGKPLLTRPFESKVCPPISGCGDDLPLGEQRGLLLERLQPPEPDGRTTRTIRPLPTSEWAGLYDSNVPDCRRWGHQAAERQLPALAKSHSRPTSAIQPSATPTAASRGGTAIRTRMPY
jgi:hypothetical protein